MYGGPRNPNSSPFQGGSRPLPQNFRPRFENPGFPPQPHPNAYWDFRPRQPYPPSMHLQRPFGMITHPQEPRGTFQPRGWQMSVPRRGFPPAGNHDQQRTRVWNKLFSFFAWLWLFKVIYEPILQKTKASLHLFKSQRYQVFVLSQKLILISLVYIQKG